MPGILRLWFLFAHVRQEKMYGRLISRVRSTLSIDFIWSPAKFFYEKCLLDTDISRLGKSVTRFWRVSPQQRKFKIRYAPATGEILNVEKWSLNNLRCQRRKTNVSWLKRKSSNLVKHPHLSVGSGSTLQLCRRNWTHSRWPLAAAKWRAVLPSKSLMPISWPRNMCLQIKREVVVRGIQNHPSWLTFFHNYPAVNAKGTSTNASSWKLIITKLLFMEHDEAYRNFQEGIMIIFSFPLEIVIGISHSSRRNGTPTKVRVWGILNWNFKCDVTARLLSILKICKWYEHA